MSQDRPLHGVLDEIVKRLKKLEQGISNPRVVGVYPTTGMKVTDITIGTTPFGDGSAPGIVSGVTVTVAHLDDRVYANISWSPPTDGAVSFYSVLIAKKKISPPIGDYPYELPDVVTSSTPNIQARQLEPNTTYGIRIYATAPDGGRGSYWPGPTADNWYDFTTGSDSTIPAIPTGVTITSSVTAVMVTWNENTEPDVAGGKGLYEVQLDTTADFSSGSVKDVRVSSTITSFLGLTGGTTYYTRVQAVDSSGNPSGYSGVASAVPGSLTTGSVSTDGFPPPVAGAPSVLGLVGALFVKWTPVGNPDPVTYDVHVGTVSTFTPSPSTLATSTPSNTAVVKVVNSSSLLSGTTYYVKIVARDADGSSGASTATSGSLVLFTSADIADGTIGTADISFTSRDIGGITTFTTGTTPTGAKSGDLWIDTANGNVIKQYNGTSWSAYQAGTGAIATGAVTASQIAANTITASQIAAGTITAAQIATGTITAANLVAGTITAAQIAAGTITSASGVIGALDAGSITTGTLAAGRIGAGTIASDKIDVAGLDAAVIKFGTMSGDRIAANTIHGSQIIAGEITTAHIAAGAITAIQIATNAITADAISAGSITASALAVDALTAANISAGSISGVSISGHVLGSQVTGSDFVVDSENGRLLVYQQIGTVVVTATTVTAGTTWTVPAGVTLAKFEAWGPGANGALSDAYSAGGGGGGGEYACEPNVPVVPGDTFTYTVEGPNSAGASTVIDHNTGTGPALHVEAYRGVAGVAGRGGPGGTGSLNSIHFNGGSGGAPSGPLTNAGSGGGSSAGTRSNGNQGSKENGALGGTGGSAPSGGGDGGHGGSLSTNVGATSGTSPGGGGGGRGRGSASSAQAGGIGKVRITTYSSVLVAVVSNQDGTDPVTGQAYQAGVAVFGRTLLTGTGWDGATSPGFVAGDTVFNSPGVGTVHAGLVLGMVAHPGSAQLAARMTSNDMPELWMRNYHTTGGFKGWHPIISSDSGPSSDWLLDYNSGSAKINGGSYLKSGRNVQLRYDVKMPAITVPSSGNITNTKIGQVIKYFPDVRSPIVALGPIGVGYIDTDGSIWASAFAPGTANIASNTVISWLGSYTTTVQYTP